MKSENDDSYLAGLLSKLLQEHQIVSMSFLNSQFKGKGMPFCITFDFLKRFPVFNIAVIGSDLKISQNEVNKNQHSQNFDENNQFYLDLSQILVKDTNTASNLKKKLINNEGDAALSKLQDDWSSNKYKYNLPFIVRNSHKFILYMKNDKSFIKERCGNDIELDVRDIWEIAATNVKDLVAICLRNLLRNVDYPVNQGTLQACIDYGFAAIDKNFMTKYEETFVGGGEKGIALRGSRAEKLIVTSGTTKSKTKTMAIRESLFTRK